MRIGQTTSPNSWNHAWFFRSWTFQEAVLANNSVVITSSATLGWDALARGFGFLCKGSVHSGSRDISHKNIIYYESISQTNIPYRTNFRWNGYGRPAMPNSSVALEPLLVLWMRIDRSTVVTNGRHGRESTPCSIYYEQKA